MTIARDYTPSGEGVFLACSFWLADAYQLQGRDADANAIVDRLLALRNDLGLLSEEYDTAAKRQVGNTAFGRLLREWAFTRDKLVPAAQKISGVEPIGRAMSGSRASWSPGADKLRRSRF